jgi:hypothetical protein
VSEIELTLFDFIDEVVHDIEQGVLEGESRVESGSTILVFCQGFFDQFFAALGENITGFRAKAKRDAAAFVERLRSRTEPAMEQARKIIVAFEEFCDLAKDVLGDYTDTSITFERVADFVRRLLRSTQHWAELSDKAALAARAGLAHTSLEAVT